MTTKTIITPKTLITNREILIAEIKKAWGIISANNVLPTAMGPKFDLPAVYKTITDNEQKLIKVKLALQLINLGFKSLSELPEDNSYTSVFLLQQVKERIIKLKLIPTKKDENETVVFTRSFIETETKKLETEQKKIEAELEQFNSSINFQMD